MQIKMEYWISPSKHACTLFWSNWNEKKKNKQHFLIFKQILSQWHHIALITASDEHASEVLCLCE